MSSKAAATSSVTLALISMRRSALSKAIRRPKASKVCRLTSGGLCEVPMCPRQRISRDIDQRPPSRIRHGEVSTGGRSVHRSRARALPERKEGQDLDLFGQFNQSWRKDLEHFLVDEKADAIGTIVANRHKIAHGEDSTLTYVRVKEHWEEVQRVVEHIADLVDPP